MSTLVARKCIENERENEHEHSNFFSEEARIPFPEMFDGDVNTLELLDFYEDYCQIYEKIGGIISILSKDVMWSSSVLRKLYEENPGKHHTVKALLAAEFQRGDLQGARTASFNIMWLTRALHTIYESLIQVVELEQSTRKKRKDFNRIAYENYLKVMAPYHSFFKRKSISAGLLYLAPSGDAIFKKICHRDDTETRAAVARDIIHYFRNVPQYVKHIDNIYRDLGLHYEHYV